MWKLWTTALLAAAPLPAATLDPNTVTVTATRAINIQPDQASLYISLTTAREAGLDDALAQLQGSGIAAANLGSVYSSATSSVWNFNLTVAFAKLKDTLATLNQLQAAMGSNGPPSLTYSVTGAQISPQLQASQPCPYTALVSDARRQADAMAAAAGMKTGAIVSVSDGTSVDGTLADPQVGVPIYEFWASSTLPGTLSLALLKVITATPPSACSLTVQFKLVP